MTFATEKIRKAQLSQRDRATFRVSEYFANKVTHGLPRSFEMTLLSRAGVSPY